MEEDPAFHKLLEKARSAGSLGARVDACQILVRRGRFSEAEEALVAIAAEPSVAAQCRRLLEAIKQFRRWGIAEKFVPYSETLDESGLLGSRVPLDFEGERNVLVSRCDGAQKCILVFTGNAKQFFVSIHVLHQILAHFDCHVVYLTDHLRLGYMFGLPGLGVGFEPTAAGLSRLLASIGGPKLYVMGSSAGGYASVRYGAALGARSILTFAPQVKLPEDAQTRIGEALASVGRPSLNATPDLREVLRDAEPHPRLFIVYGAESPDDVENARHLEGAPAVSLHPVEGYAGHDVLAQTMADGSFRSWVERLLACE